MSGCLSDEVLSAYIDGELQPAEAASVALALTRNPEAMRRLNALRESDALLREAFDWPLAGNASLTERLAGEMHPRPRWRRSAPMLAVVGATIVAAAAAGFALGRLSAPRAAQVDSSPGVIASGTLGIASNWRKSGAPAGEAEATAGDSRR
jgi:anti-sigma factor RsiW